MNAAPPLAQGARKCRKHRDCSMIVLTPTVCRIDRYEEPIDAEGKTTHDNVVVNCPHELEAGANLHAHEVSAVLAVDVTSEEEHAW